MYKILLLNLPGPVFKAGTRWPSKIKFRKAQIRYYPYPWFMGYATALLKKEGFTTKLIDAIAMEWSVEKTKKYIEAWRPTHIVCEPTAVSLKEDIDFLNQLPRKITKIAVGQFATSVPLKCIQGGFDWAVIGEYEFSLLEFFQGKEKSIPKNFVSANKAVGQMPDLMTNLDLFPWPERNDTPIQYYNEPSCYGRNVVMISSRGCRLNCSYCTINNFYGQKVIRTRSAENVVDEMEYLKNNYRFDEIYFDDDNITAKAGHLELICDEIIRRKLKVSWVCMGDGLIPLASIDKLARAGCTMYKFGVEHFDPEVLKAIPKPLNFQKVYDIVTRCKRNKIKTHLTFMVGLPHSTFKKDINMVKQVIQINPTAVQFAIATPYPGTRFYEEAKKDHWLLKNNLSIYDASGSAAISYPDYSHSEINQMYCLAWQIWRRHVIFSQPLTSLFFLMGNLKREGLIKTITIAYSYLQEAIQNKK